MARNSKLKLTTVIEVKPPIRIKLSRSAAVQDLARVISPRLDRARAEFAMMRGVSDEDMAYYLDGCDDLFRKAAEYQMLKYMNRLCAEDTIRTVDWAGYRNDLWHSALRAAHSTTQSTSYTSNLMQKYTGAVMCEAIHEDLGKGALISLIDRIIKAQHGSLIEEYPYEAAQAMIRDGEAEALDQACPNRRDA